MAKLEWSEFACAERAQVGLIEFFVADSRSGAELYTDGSSFDQSYGGTRYPSVAEAKAAAEQALREMHDALVAHFAPVLQWECDLHSVATLGQWFLQADSEEWSVMACPPGGERAVVVSGSRCTTRENNRRAAENALRALGVTFRVEGE